MRSLVEHSIGLWTRTQGAGERSLTTVVERFFADQLRRVTVALADFQRPTPTDVATIFNVADEERRLFTVLRPQLGRLAAIGIQRQLALASASHGSKAVDETGIDFGGSLPTNFLAALRRFLLGLERQRYWAEIQRTTEQRIIDVVEAGLTDGDSHRQLATRLRDSLGGDESKRRAMMIARTESTGSLNAGHYAAQVELASGGVAMKKAWSSILDEDARQPHAALNNVAVAVNEQFNVGGSLAPYPGYFELPGQQRINCRCTIISTFD